MEVALDENAIDSQDCPGSAILYAIDHLCQRAYEAQMCALQTRRQQAVIIFCLLPGRTSLLYAGHY